MLGLSPGGMSRRLDIGIAVCCACAITGELHASQIHGQEMDRWGPLIDASKPTASPDGERKARHLNAAVRRPATCPSSAACMSG